MAPLSSMRPFANIYQDLPVLVTGHTGFKGSWLTAWLLELGANVIGYSLPELPTPESNFALAHLSPRITDIRGDIGDLDHLRQVIAEHQPAIIFHLAAQSIVLRSLQEPQETMAINMAGTVNVLEAIRQTDSVKALVSVATNKVYEQRGWLWSYREVDRLGARDPYSASKAMVELAIEAYRQSYFPADRYAEHGVAIASARADNVIGGGDFGAYRLVPDCMRSLLAGESICLHNPHSVRPWQHVLEPLSGYLWLGTKLLREGTAVAEAWNFGPLEQIGITTQQIADKLIELWGDGAWVHNQQNLPAVEASQPRLNWDKAATRLDWQPIYSWQQALAEIVAWFKAYQAQEDMYQVCLAHIHDYTQQARRLNLGWCAADGG